MEENKSPDMIRYYKNKKRYNTRAKKYFNEIYYPLKKNILLEKARKEREIKRIYNIKNNIFYTYEDTSLKKKNKIKKEKKENINYRILYTCKDTSLTISFD
jgi:hypothetical protein